MLLAYREVKYQMSNVSEEKFVQKEKRRNKFQDIFFKYLPH